MAFPTSQGLRKDVLLPFAVMFSTNVLPVAIVDYSRSLVLRIALLLAKRIHTEHATYRIITRGSQF
jgi:hypothetical protein